MIRRQRGRERACHVTEFILHILGRSISELRGVTFENRIQSTILFTWTFFAKLVFMCSAMHGHVYIGSIALDIAC